MTRASRPLDIVGDSLQHAAERDAVHHILDDTSLDGRTVQLDGRSLLNFASCSYLGLEVDPPS